jgi:hypothetical protein
VVLAEPDNKIRGGRLGFESAVEHLAVDVENDPRVTRRIKKSILQVRFFMLVFLMATPFIARVRRTIKRNRTTESRDVSNR